MRKRSSLLVGLVGVFGVGTNTVESMRVREREREGEWPYSGVRIAVITCLDVLLTL